jgi:hypothetical protein
MAEFLKKKIVFAFLIKKHVKKNMKEKERKICMI